MSNSNDPNKSSTIEVTPEVMRQIESGTCPLCGIGELTILHPQLMQCSRCHDKAEKSGDDAHACGIAIPLDMAVHMAKNRINKVMRVEAKKDATDLSTLLGLSLEQSLQVYEFLMDRYDIGRLSEKAAHIR